MEKCADFLNHEFERVFNKNNLAAGVTIFNIYMASLDLCGGRMVRKREHG